MSTSFARQIVRDALRIRDQERFWVHTWDHSFDLAQEIVEQIQLHGAAAILSVTSESSVIHVLKKAPQEAVTTPIDHWLSGVSKSNAKIIGHGDPAGANGTVYSDVSTLTTALDLIGKAEVMYTPKK